MEYERPELEIIELEDADIMTFDDDDIPTTSVTVPTV